MRKFGRRLLCYRPVSFQRARRSGTLSSSALKIARPIGLAAEDITTRLDLAPRRAFAHCTEACAAVGKVEGIDISEGR